MRNVVLVGMPGAGKSTAGVILAKVLGYQFIDSDLLIQKQEKKLLHQIIATKGLDAFIEIENKVNASIEAEEAIIATGGSVIYGKEAMEHLRAIGTVVYIKLSYDTLCKRLGNIKQRGVVLKEGQDLRGLYDERCPLYEQYCHFAIDAENLDAEGLVEAIRNLLFTNE
ncbi:shikimate kinase [Anaerosporobacter faecicola]|uniref:shikimate kinase n=1 Tax=Anaerosporobacter faecicola TaxID=2718714 RepID=UPI0014397C15|nr:shikimate kinase [Anaerosporobacter faecicola]